MDNNKAPTKANTDKKKDNFDIALEMMQNPLIQAEGEAASQILQAYKGVRYDRNGIDLQHQGRNLKDISNYRVNPNYREKNLKQQAGFDAELLHEVRENKHYIRTGNKTRVRTTDGLGMTNDTRYDHVKVNESGEIIEHSGTQMKFYGISYKGGKEVYQVVEKMVKDESWDRYDAINIPKEQYECAKKYAVNQSKELREQAQELRRRQQYDKAIKLENKATRYEMASERLEKSRVTTDDAMLARLNPERLVTKEVLKDISYAGTKAAAGAAIASASLSTVQNLYAVACREKDIGEAAVDIAKDTIKAGAVGFGVGTAGTTFKTLMHNSSKELIRRCGSTSLPTVLATSVVEVSKSIKRYANNEIDEMELVTELGEKGIGILASGYGMTVGGVIGGALGSVIPILGTGVGAAVGGFVGSVVGYSASAILYYGALGTLSNAKISETRRSAIERMANEAIRENKKYISKLNEYLDRAHEEYKEKVIGLLENMQECIYSNDADGYVKRIEEFGQVMGISLDIKTFDEFDMYMENDELAIIL